MIVPPASRLCLIRRRRLLFTAPPSYRSKRPGAGVEVKPLRTVIQREAGSKYRGGKVATTLMSRTEMLAALLQYSHGHAWCCGFISDTEEDRRLILTNYELDHVIPKSKGGDDEIYNRAPLCKAHNLLKSDRDINLYELRNEVIYRRELAPGFTPERLVKLDLAHAYATQLHCDEYQKKYGAPLFNLAG